VSTELTLLSRVAYQGREVTAPRLRGLLALLAGDLRRGCSTARLVEGLWPDEQPENPAKALQILVSRARAQLGADLIVTTPTGYRLALGEDQVDTSVAQLRASAAARCAEAGDQAAALAHAEAGLALWAGAAAGDGGPDDPVAALRAEWASTQRSLVRARALALARLGRHAEAAAPLAALARDRPRDEEVLAELLRGEAATQGPSAALARFEAYRRSLREELGSDPGPALQALQHQLLQGSLPVVRHGVAQEPNPLLGRDHDLVAVAGLLRSSRVTSVVGPGGLGKTRLAQAVSRRAEQRVVQFVALAGVAADDDVAREVAAAVSAGASGRGPVGQRPVAADPLTGIVAALGPGPALLVLDNCEHVLDGAAGLVGALVSATRELRVLATSRAPLGLSSEAVYPLPELGLATMVELFTQRARAARPGVALPADLVEGVCRRLDGLPLAVELAAARVRVLSVAEVARGLQDRFGLLRGGARDAPARHQTLEAVVGWSWNLLEPAGQAAMRALSVFAAGFTADAAQRVLADGDGGGGDVPRVLEHLVDQSLLQVADTAAGARLRMLETVREFSTARREAAGETDRAVGGFLAWARGFGVAHHDGAFGPDPYAPLARMRAEQDNLAQALRYALARADGGTVAATAAVLGCLWLMESNYQRVMVLADETAQVLSHFRPGPDLVEATRTTLALCTAYTFLLEGPRAVRSLVALRRLPPAPPDTLMRAVAVVFGAAGKDRSALYELADGDEPLVAAAANAVVSYFWENQGDLERALKAARRMLEAFEQRKLPYLQAIAHTRIGELCLQVERGEEARRHLLAVLPVLERLGTWPDLVGIRWWLVLASLQVGAVDEAEHWLEQTAPARADEPVGTLTYGLGVRAEILLARGEVEAGLRLWRRAVDLLVNAEGPIFGVDVDPSQEQWTLEAKAATVVAHAQHGRLDLVEELTGALPQQLSKMLANPAANPPPYLMELPTSGGLLLALAMVDLDRGARSGDERATRSGARLVALAERFRFPRNFQPTMAAARVRQAATHADRPAYDEAVSSYAGLGAEELRAAALAALRARGQG
jgi:predicted ATPase/DNA-binding SARP family transcriptional activator/tetratricopeptide (TPR) repeat protein